MGQMTSISTEECAKKWEQNQVENCKRNLSKNLSLKCL